MPSKLLEENERAHFMTKRFDREKGNVKHHIQTFCGIQHYDYNNVTGYSYEQLYQTMRLLRLTYPEAEQMFRRMVFNVLASNNDDHTKNFSFLLKKDSKWQLAPAYDLCYSYDPNSIWVSQHSLSINGKRKNISREDLLSIAKANSIKNPNKIIDEIKTIVCNWQEYAKKAGVNKKLKKAISQNLECFKLNSK
jgi:serine/threonine-protein kinase HipA